MTGRHHKPDPIPPKLWRLSPAADAAFAAWRTGDDDELLADRWERVVNAVLTSVTSPCNVLDDLLEEAHRNLRAAWAAKDDDQAGFWMAAGGWIRTAMRRTGDDTPPVDLPPSVLRDVRRDVDGLHATIDGPDGPVDVSTMGGNPT